MIKDRGPALDAERAVNEQYLRIMEALVARQPAIAKLVANPQNAVWSGHAPRPAMDARFIEPLIGRVALAQEDEILGRTYYIGHWRPDGAPFEVVSWASRAGKVFYLGKRADFDVAGDLAARRTFGHRLGDLTSCSDELESGVPATPCPFDGARELTVPAAPKAARPGKRAKPPVHPESSEASRASEPEGLPTVAERKPPTAGAAEPTLRAEEVVRELIAQPKTGGMQTLLATLQPDQYELVTWDPRRSVIVQGQPGTGKTVVAAHRAGYLTHPDNDHRVKRVAIIGPTDQYVEHVAPVVRSLANPEAEIHVLSMTALLRDAAGIKAMPRFEADSWLDGDWDLPRMVRRFVRALPGEDRRSVRQVYEALRDHDEETLDVERRDWLQALPAWPQASGSTRHLPLLATIGAAVEPRRRDRRYDHLIVDESQDVCPAEWRLLQDDMLTSDGCMTLLGDINQRRSDWSIPSWRSLADSLELTDLDGNHHEVHLAVGYRSTREIIRFANQLLPSGERENHALQRGPDPEVRKVSAGSMLEEIERAVRARAAQYEGIIAVICPAPRSVTDDLRKRGWSRISGSTFGWSKAGVQIAVLHPDQARGLEFDAVIVAEPEQFPTNLGRDGVLYTALTRASKHLTVLHVARKLPGGLRPPR